MLLTKSLMIVIILNSVTCYSHSKRMDDLEPNTLLPRYSYITRSEWKARISKRILIDSHEPVSLIVVKHTNTPSCYVKHECIKSVKKLQHQSMTNGAHDIKYNFVIDPHGNVFEGLGWFTLVPDDNINPNYRTIGFIGMENTGITPTQAQAVTELFKEGLMLKFLNKNYHFWGMTYVVEEMKKIKYYLQMEMYNVDDHEFNGDDHEFNDYSNEQYDNDYEAHI